MRRTCKVAVVLLAAAWLLGACGEEEAVQILPEVEVTQGPLIYKASFHGELEAAKSVAIHAPELSGVDFLTVDTFAADGTMVKEGDEVLTFVRGPLEDELRSAETELAVAEAELSRTNYDLEQERVKLELDVKRKQMNLERAELFVVEGVNLISKLELNKYKLDVDKAKIELALARKAMRAFGQKRATALEIQQLRVTSKQREVDEKRQNLENMTLKAPASGMLYGPYTRLNWVRGKVAAGSVCRPGDKLLELPDLSRFNVLIHVRQRDAALLTVGDTALVYPTASPSEGIKATITQKDDVATTRNERLGTELPENNLKEIKIVLELETSSPVLRPGGTARVDLEVELAKDAVLVPLAAVQTDAGRNSVKLPNGESADVKLGKASTAFAQVLEGLEVGQSVLLSAASEAPSAKDAPTP